ncbi:hypothetical protein BDE27_1772 [Xenorhabdus ehlersii]|uniref:3',5'-cyclic adenosine monophosphate phosphodiesterase CpdA n=1 Tax=Xenorhabdus ehlersii TaxID=290111 RepID=A0A2D0IWG1_9GAMM|nr:3',5'-cyclic adenosine monophosphate phosphodiesterase CpdA [Xenorhabdus sp. TS4]PHM26273.1 3',5'-cyclic adenosine monophosphate phosphodiesterase CpdA [Xenorhabdus ehlersii]RKE91524.1 hypothetical protein BDE27_1772 [Xenorhabdus ehlersii]
MKIVHLTYIHLTKYQEQKIFDKNPYDNFDFICEKIHRLSNLIKIELILGSGNIA